MPLESQLAHLHIPALSLDPCIQNRGRAIAGSTCSFLLFASRSSKELEADTARTWKQDLLH
jgi:hypothetical protein